MVVLSHKALISVSGGIWFSAGFMLLTKGLNYLIDAVKQPSLTSDYPLLNALNPYLESVEQSALLIIILSLMIGYAKGKFVLGKSAKQGIERIYSFSNPTYLSNIYSTKSYILLGLMMGLGFLMNVVGTPKDIRGFVDVAVGSALINGAMIYFRSLFKEKFA